MLVFELFCVAYILTAISTIIMVHSAIQGKPYRAYRVVFTVLGLIMPFIFVYATIKALFSSREVIPYNQEIAQVEDGIESERVRIFGGELTRPSFNMRWEKAYAFHLQRLAENVTKASEKLAMYAHLGRAA